MLIVNDSVAHNFTFVKGSRSPKMADKDLYEKIWGDRKFRKK